MNRNFVEHKLWSKGRAATVATAIMHAGEHKKYEHFYYDWFKISENKRFSLFSGRLCQICSFLTSKFEVHEINYLIFISGWWPTNFQNIIASWYLIAKKKKNRMFSYQIIYFTLMIWTRLVIINNNQRQKFLRKFPH